MTSLPGISTLSQFHVANAKQNEPRGKIQPLKPKMQKLITKTITIILMAATISTVLVGCATHKCCNGNGGGISAMPFGADKDGVAVKLVTLRNQSGTEATICNYGGLVTSLKVADRHGKLDDVTLGYDDLASYIKDTPYFAR